MNLTLPEAGSFEWVPGANAQGIGDVPTAAGVETLVGKITKDLDSWFGGTGQALVQNTELAIKSSTEFDIMSRPRYSGMYAMAGVSLTEELESLTLTFSNSGAVIYSLWSYDTAAKKATELIGGTLAAAGTTTDTYTGTLASGTQLFVLWGTGALGGAYDGQYVGGGISLTVSGIALSGDTPSVYYWAPADTAGNGAWAAQSWLDNNAGSAVALPAKAADVAFDNAAYTDAAVTVAGDAQARNMSLTQGTYRFTADGAASLSVTDTLTVNGADVEFDFAVTADNVTVEAGSLKGKTLTVGDSAEDVFAISGGSVSLETIAGKGKVQITGGEVEISDYITAAGGTSVTGATLVGTTKLDGSKGSPLSLGTITVDAVSVHLAYATLADTITLTQGDLSFSGMMILNKNAFTAEQTLAYSAADNSGYCTETDAYTVVTGNLEGLQSDARWLIGGIAGELKSDGKVYVSQGTDTSVYWVRGTTVADAAWEQLLADNATPAVQLDGGTLQVGKEYAAAAAIGGNGTVELQNGASLSRNNIASDAAAVYLSGAGSYYTENAATLHAKGGVKLADTWAGTVHVGDAPDGVPMQLTGLANASSSIAMGRVDVPTLQVQSALSPAKHVGISFLSLAEGTSAIYAEEVSVNQLHLGSGGAAASLTVSGTLTLEQSTVYWEHPDSTLTAARLAAGTTSLNFVMDSHLLANATGENVLLTLTDPTAEYAEVSLTLNGNSANERVAAEGSKHAYNLVWDAAQQAVVLHAMTNPDYVTQKYADATGNAAAGVQLLNAAFAQDDPQSSQPGSDLARVLDSVDASALTPDGLAAVAGSSVTTLGMALSGDVERRLRAIRNRTTTMGANLNHAHPDMPYYNAWVNAEGDFTELDGEGQYPGYQLDSWGGTLGVDVDITPHLTAGFALTAMYGDLSTDGPDRADGDMDTYYLTLFARYARSAWTHTFVGTIGMADMSVNRTVSHSAGSYTATGDTEGMAFGLMYELGHVFVLNEARTACLQPVVNVMYRHTAVDAYQESGSNAALSVGEQSLDTVTFGLGARLQAELGETIFNRKSIFEARALARVDVGDRRSSADVAFLHAAGCATVESAEMDAFGVELGAGLTLPLGTDSALFIDASAELRGSYTHFNGTVGYRINF